MKLLKQMYCDSRTVNKFNRSTLIRVSTLIKREKMILKCHRPLSYNSDSFRKGG